jgi:hypothetical protein
MKSMYKIFYLSLFLVVFTACQDELIKVVEPSQSEVLKANSNVASLVQRTVTKDGSKDNIIDNSSCIEIELPVTVIVNGLEITIDSEDDFEVIEAIFDEFDDDLDNLEIFFPIEIILSDYSKITINNYDELESIIDECDGNNELDDDIECLDFVYPITLSIYNSENQLIETVKVENDEQFYKFMDEIEDDDIVTINFPITVVLYDGTEKHIENMDDLENTIDDAKDMCDEDDDNDYDDDDCDECTTEQITELLMTCSWKADKLIINDDEQTEQYSDYLFTFLEDGVLLAENNGNELFGTWEIDQSEDGILVKINFEELSDFSFNWRLYEIEDDNEIDLRIEENRLKLEKVCHNDDDKTEMIEILKEGIWIVANFIDDHENTTDNYNGFAIDFESENVVTATKGDDVVEGTWKVFYDDDKLKLELNFGETEPFDKFNEDWLAVDIKENRVEVNNLDNNGDEESKLVFERD